MKLLYLPFIIQGLVMVVDEFYFHEKRDLPLWERIGHPLDTLSVLSVFLLLLSAGFQSSQLPLYIGLCALSCVFITKDELVHAQHCRGLEHWLHSLLFLIHPLCFLSAYLLWLGHDLTMLKLQVGMISVFMIYQILRWSIPWQTPVK